MKAVNLIPADQRRGGTGLGRSGGAVYAILGLLGFVVVAAVVYVLSVNAVTSKREDLHGLQAQTQVAQAKADALAPYRTFAALKQARVQTIQSLASSRFDWERVMRKLALVIPSDVWLTSLVGTVAPGVQLQAGSGGEASGLRSALPVPAVELTGCTTGQAEVSRFMSRLRVIDGVTRVSLASSEKGDTAGGTGGSSSGSSGGDDGCEKGSASHPQFDLVVFFGRTAK